MNKIGVFLFVVTGVFCWIGNASYAEPDISDKTEIKATATAHPDSVLIHFFDLLHRGQSSEAQKLFRIQNPDQEMAVRNFVTNGIKFFKKVKIDNVVVMTFKNNQFSVCAIEQSSSAYPGKFELESSALVFEDGLWKLLPLPQDYRAGINGLSAQELAEFGVLWKEFASFKRSYKK